MAFCVVTEVLLERGRVFGEYTGRGGPALDGPETGTMGTVSSTMSAGPGERRPVLALARGVGRVLLGAALVFAGVAHLTGARREFQAQVPAWLPADPDLVVVASGVLEVVLGLALVLTTTRFRPHVGLVAALFFVAVLPGNVAQYVDQISAFGLDTDTKRAARLLGQPVLVAWALWSTAGWTLLRRRR